MPDEVLNSIQKKQNKYMDELKASIYYELNNSDDYVDCSDKDDIARYILDMVHGALVESMFMTFDTLKDLDLLKIWFIEKEV